MSVTLEKRRKVAELENFEERIRQEKRRLLGELERLESPFSNRRTTRWIKNFSSDIAEGWRARHGSASSRTPVWVYIVATIILLGGGFAANLAWRGTATPRADGSTQRQAETPTTPARIEQPTAAPVKETARAGDAAPSSAPSVSVEPGLAAAPTPSTPEPKNLGERLLEAQSATEPLPEPLPPPIKPAAPAAAPAYGAGALSPLDQERPKTAFDDAPPVDAAALAEPDNPPAAPESRREDEPAKDGRHAKCFVKVDGRVLFQRDCLMSQPSRSTFNLTAGDEAIVLTLEHGRTWTASLGGRSLGKVYRSGSCWGRRREVYICAKGA